MRDHYQNKYSSVHGNVRDHIEDLKIRYEIRKFKNEDTIVDKIRAMFAQYMQKQGKSKSKHAEGSNIKREHHRDPYYQREYEMYSRHHNNDYYQHPLLRHCHIPKENYHPKKPKIKPSSLL